MVKIEIHKTVEIKIILSELDIYSSIFTINSRKKEWVSNSVISVIMNFNERDA